MGKRKVTISLDSDIYREFQQYCEDNAIMISKKIEIWMIDFLADKKKKRGDS